MSTKTVLITGASSGFGEDTAVTLASVGYRVFATMRAVNGKHSTKAKELRSKGIEVIEMDVQNDASVEAAFEALFQKTGGKLDVIINNAGQMVQGVSEAITIEQTRDMFDVNVLGIQRVMRTALPRLRKNKSGLIINVGSVLGRVTIPFLGLYGATKFAVDAITESYRYELSQLGIDVVLLQPSAYPTGLYGHVNASDNGREKEYGPVADASAAFVEFIQGMFSGDKAPNPHDVAKAIADIIATPSGKRPERVVVGASFGADAANAALEPIQNQLIDGLGMQTLKKLKVA